MNNAIEVSTLMDAFINGDIEGCVQIPRVDAGDSDYKPDTVVFLDGAYQTGCVSASASEGWIDRCILKEGHTLPLYKSDVEWDDDKDEIATERRYGKVIVLVCSPKMIRLLQKLSKGIWQ